MSIKYINILILHLVTFTFLLIFEKKDRKTFLLIEITIFIALSLIHFFKNAWVHTSFQIPGYHYVIRVIADLSLFIYIAYIVKSNHEAKQKYILENYC